jgi:DNA-binding NarL/FixJ family response regulator
MSDIEKNVIQTENNLKKRRILLVDNHPIVRYGLNILIKQEHDLEICGQSSTAIETLENINRLNPDIVVIDVSLKGSNSLELTKSIKQTNPSLPVLMLSMHDEKLYAERALRAGARGYLIKQEPADIIPAAIRKVLNGKLYLSKNLSSKFLHEIVDGTIEEGLDKFGVDTLSDRELEIFEFIGRGQSSRNIATRLQLSIKTIETHRAHIKQKLKIDNATELVHRAFRWVESGSNGN